jgi:hypothetical protein
VIFREYPYLWIFSELISIPSWSWLGWKGSIYLEASLEAYVLTYKPDSARPSSPDIQPTVNFYKVYCSTGHKAKISAYSTEVSEGWRRHALDGRIPSADDSFPTARLYTLTKVAVGRTGRGQSETMICSAIITTLMTYTEG